MAEIAAQSLLQTPTVEIRDVCCEGRCRHVSAEEHVAGIHLVFPYRGVYVRHLGSDEAVAEANQVLFFNPGEGYRVSHPVAGGDASLDLVHRPSRCCASWRRGRCCAAAARFAFRAQRLRIDARAQALVALLRHSLRDGIAEPLEAESLALTLVRAIAGAAHHARARRQPRAGAGSSIAPSSCSPAISRGAGRWPRSPPRSAVRRCT